jgi:hypothetical protein
MQRWVVFLLLAGLTAAWAAEPTVAPTAEDKALATKALALAKVAEGNMGRETANFLLRDWPNGLAKMLLGDAPATASGLTFARDVVKGMLVPLERAATWPKPPALQVPRAKTAPKIDGTLDDPAWKRARVLRGAYAFNETAKVDNTTWRLLWDAQYLYIGVACTDDDVIAPVVERDGKVFDNDCIEAFVLPDWKTLAYWELEVSAVGGLMDNRCVKNPDHWGGKMDTTATLAGWQVATTVQGTANTPGDTDTGYTVEMAIPVTQLPGMTPESAFTRGQTLRLLLARMDRGKGAFTAYAAFPTLSWTHNVWNYATVTLAK